MVHSPVSSFVRRRLYSEPSRRVLALGPSTLSTPLALRYRAGYATIAENGETAKPNPFPFPVHANPTPYQIFHLPVHASKQQIKSRYYELVRAHHPDSAFTAHLSQEEAHANFRHIKSSYDFLTGKASSPHPNARTWQPDGSSFDPYAYELARRRRAYYAQRNRAEQAEAERPAWAKGWGGLGAHPEEQSNYDQNGWRERTMFFFGVITLMAGLFPNLPNTLATVFLPASLMGPDFFAEPQQEKKKDDGPPGTAPPFNIPFIDLDRGHRAAVSALIQAREEAKETGAERREQIKRRVAEMGLNRDGTPTAVNDTPSPVTPAESVISTAPPGVVLEQPVPVPNVSSDPSMESTATPLDEPPITTQPSQ